MGWIDEVLGRELKRKRKKYSIIMISMVILGIISMITMPYLDGKNVLSDFLFIILFGTFGVSFMIGLLVFFLILLNSNHRLKCNIKKGMKGKGELQSLEEDMLSATIFNGNNYTTYVGAKYILQVWWKRMNANQVQIVNYREAQKVRIEDTMQSFIDKMYYLKFTDSNHRIVGSLELSNKENVMNLLKLIESNTAKRNEKIQDTMPSQAQINNAEVSKDIIKLKGPSAVVTIIFGTLWLVVASIIIIYKVQMIPSDIVYTGTVSATPYRTVEYWNTYYIDYLVIPSGNTFHEEVSYSTYLNSSFNTETIEREEYYSPKKDVYIYIDEKGLTPQQVINNERWEGIIIPIVVSIIGCCIVSLGVIKAIKTKKGEK